MIPFLNASTFACYEIRNLTNRKKGGWRERKSWRKQSKRALNISCLFNVAQNSKHISFFRFIINIATAQVRTHDSIDAVRNCTIVCILFAVTPLYRLSCVRVLVSVFFLPFHAADYNYFYSGFEHLEWNGGMGSKLVTTKIVARDNICYRRGTCK